MGLLNGGVSALFGQVFGAFYLDATLHRAGEITYTDGVITGTGATDVPAKAQVDAATYAMVNSDGYVDGDMRIMILNPGVPVTTDDEITVAGTRWKIQSVTQDPAVAYYECRGRKA